jgi:hypothetical protein
MDFKRKENKMNRDSLRREKKLFLVKAEVFDKIYDFYLHQRTLQTDNMKKSVRDFMKNNTQLFGDKNSEEYEGCPVEILGHELLAPLHNPGIKLYIPESRY